MNKLTMSGIVTKDPDFRYSENGTAFVRANISITEGRDKKRTDYFNIVAFYEVAEQIAHLKKGDVITFEAKLQNNNYEKDGKKIYQDRILVEKLITAEVKKGGKQITPTPDDDLPF